MAEKLDFTIELRGSIHVMVWPGEGCRPASDEEVAMWKALNTRAQLHSLQGAGEAVAWQTVCSSQRRFSANKCSAYERARHWREQDKSGVAVEPLYTHPADPDAVPVRRELLERIIECTPGTWMAKELRALLADREWVRNE